MDSGTPPATRAPSTLSIARTVVLFAIAYAVVDLVLGVVPVNIVLRRYMGDTMPHVWLVSFARLVLRAILSGAACAATLRATGRTGGPLTTTAPRGIMSIGAITSGAVAGVLDVGAHRLLVWQLIHLAQRSNVASEVGSAFLTFAAAAIIAAILLVPRTRVVCARPSVTDALQPA